MTTKESKLVAELVKRFEELAPNYEGAIDRADIGLIVRVRKMLNQPRENA